MAQAPSPPPAPKEVAEEPISVPASISVPKRAPGTDSGRKRVVSIALYYREGIRSQKMSIPSKDFKNRKIVTFAGPKLAVA